jgi:HSP20 family protein
MSTDKRKDLRDMLDEIDRYFEKFETEVQGAVRDAFAMAKPPTKPFVAGFSFKMGPEGRPSIQIFGDSPARGGGYRSPMTEQVVDAKEGLVRLVLDMPGVEKEDIRVDASDNRAIVTAERGQRKYRAEIDLKTGVVPDSGKAEYRNGLLEISFTMKDKDNKGYRRVDIV